MSLQQQIQREIDEEARIDKRIENLKKKILRRPGNRKYRFVDTKDKAHAFLVFDRAYLSKYSIISYEEDETITKLESNPMFTIFPIRNTNPRDSRTATNGDIRANLTPISKLTTPNS